MGLLVKQIQRLFVAFFLSISCAAFSVDQLTGKESNRILFLMQAGQVPKALELYQSHRQQLGHHDLELVRQMGMMLLEQGYRTGDPETRLLTLYGAGISLDERVLYLLEEGLKSNQPQHQLISLQFLERYQNDNSDEAMNRALASNYLLIRLEGAFCLAKRKAPNAVLQIEALMSKVDPELHSLFPSLFAMIGNADAIRALKKLFQHRNEQVRISAILAAAKYGRDDLLPQIRTLATHHTMPQQEACATALGIMKDEESALKLEAISHSGCNTVRLAALQALYRLGRKEVRAAIETAAKSNDVFAISLLATMPGSEDTLASLIKSDNIQVRVNAALALLERQDPRCLDALKEILVTDNRDLVFQKFSSVGKSLSYYRVIPSANENISESAISHEISLGIREKVLAKTSELSENNFYYIANALFEFRQNDLVPILVDLLERLQTPAAIDLLKKHQQKTGAPLIRNYCNLALYRLKEPGSYADNLRAWVIEKQNEDFIAFRPSLPWDLRTEETSIFQLTPEETTRLLLDSFQAFAQKQDDRGIDVLFEAIQKGNAKNKFTLAGLLIRSAQ